MKYLFLIITFIEFITTNAQTLNYDTPIIQTPFVILSGGGVTKSENCRSYDFCHSSTIYIKDQSIFKSLEKVGLYNGVKNRHALIRNK